MEEVLRARDAAVPLVRGTETAAIQSLATGVTDGVDDAIVGIPKGIVNAPAVALNGATHSAFNGPITGFYFQGSNPLEVPMIWGYDNPRQASYGSAASTVTLLVPGIVAPVFLGGASTLSVVPKEFTVPIPKPASFPKPIPVNGNSLSSMRPTWGYKLYRQDGTFLKNGITSQPVAEARYTKTFMSDKFMKEKYPFPNRAAARIWEIEQNTLNPGPLNIRR
jgi:hypothetical protein